MSEWLQQWAAQENAATAQRNIQRQNQANLNRYIQAFQQQSAAANRANEARYQQGLDIYGEIIKRYGPGGTFMQGATAQIERGLEKAGARGYQDLVSAGLASTTMPSTLRGRLEEDIGQPARLRLEDLRMERLSGAQRDLASFTERREDIGPDMGQFAGLMEGAAQQPRYSAPTGGTGGGGDFWATQPLTGNMLGGTGGTRSGVSYGEHTGQAETMEQMRALTAMAQPAEGTQGLQYEQPEIEQIAASGGPKTWKESVSYSKWARSKGITKTTDATKAQWRQWYGK
jgi:hypothetical protein